MGDVIDIAVRRRDPGVRAARDGSAARVLSFGPASPDRTVAGGRPSVDAPPLTTFFVDPAAPATYLVAERVERSVSGMHWRICPPVGGAGVPRAQRARLESRAAELRVPFSWPDEGAGEGTPLRRMAAWAASTRVTQSLTLAAGRLAFAGGHDLDDPEILAELAALAGLDVEPALVAAFDPEHDRGLAHARAVVAQLGVDTLPAIQVGTTTFCGEDRVPEALAAVRSATLARRSRRR